MAKYEVWIPEWRPHTLNQLLNARGHFDRHSMKNNDKLFVSGYMAKARVPKAEGKRKVSLHIVLDGRKQQADPDAYWKSLNDALVVCGMLVDDNSAGVELGEITYSRDPKWGTRITLEDIGE